MFLKRYLRREPDTHDRRKQTLNPALERIRDIQVVFDPIRKDMAGLLENFDTHQLTAIAEFLARSTDLANRHVALLRSDALHSDSLHGDQDTRDSTGDRSTPKPVKTRR